MKYKIYKKDEEWRKILSPEQFKVTRQKGTEPAFTGQYHDCKDKGVYQCVCCGAKLFSSDTKFDSGTGWPSFHSPMKSENVAEQEDVSFFMKRTEVHCSQCGARQDMFSPTDRIRRLALLHRSASWLEKIAGFTGLLR
jgi:peptide-methionine (R)-S-oxide reductase